LFENFEKEMFQEMKLIDSKERKNKGITFTPLNVVEHMFFISHIDKIDYINTKILEPSVGKGIFILYYLNYLIKNKIINSENVEKILSNIFAYDIKKEFIEEIKLKILKLLEFLKNENLIKILNKNFKDENFILKKFENEKFDLIIGNPPYVRIHNIDPITKEKTKEFKEIYNGMTDLSLYFIEKSFNLLNENGNLIFITSNRFVNGKYGEKFRKKFINYLTYYEDKSPFFDVQISTSIINFSKNETIDFIYNTKKLKKEENNFEDWRFDKIKNNENFKTSFKDLKVSISNGIVSGFLKAHKIDKKTKNELINEDNSLKDIIFPVLSGKDLSLDDDNYVIKNYIILAVKENINIIEKSTVLMKWFEKHKLGLENRTCFKSKQISKYYLLQSYHQPSNYTEYNYLTKRFGKLKFVKVPKNIYFLDTIYSLTFEKNIDINNILKHISDENVLKDFYTKTNKFGSNYEIHKNKFENIKI